MVSQCVGRVSRLEATGEPVRVRDSQAIKTHIFCSLQAFVRLEKMRSENLISNWYELQRNLFTLVVRDYIVENLSTTCPA
ncbi:transposase (plasmid) [Cylindrospermum sp. NIES-4074]|nr:transposase [Cylindrospermum sp. NIES-4074]